MDDQQPQSGTGDNINVGNIENSNVVAIGAGATAVYNAGLSTEAVAALMVELKRVDQPEVWDGRFPYLGLTAFQESDAQFFFGRENLVEELMERVQDARFIVIAGPSGSGKSSVARAGLFHALRQGKLEKSDSWLLATMQPKGDPIEQLAVAIDRMMKRPGAGDHLRKNGRTTPLALHQQIEPLLSDDSRQRCVLLIDQFEETFTQTKEADRAAFIALLTEAAGAENGRLTIILSMRADFISHCVRYSDLRALMNKQLQLVGAMDPSDLAKAITLPSLEVGAEIDPALVSRIMADMKGEPGALPLMSFALRDLFEAEKSVKGKPMDLTLPEYLQRGGIESALERHANKVFDKFSDEQKELARGVFSKMIEVGQERTDTRRTAVFSELVPAGTEQEAVEAVVNALAQEGVRLITTGGSGGTVTIAHEKLIDAWPWLRQLVDENREMIVLQNKINDDAKLWEGEEDSGYLYRGGRLIQVEEQLSASTLDLNELSQAFIQASLAQRQQEIEQKEAQQRRELTQQKERVTLLRRVLGVVVIFFLLAVGAAVFAANEQNRAEVNEKIAIAQTTVANAQSFQQGNQLQLSTLLAIASWENDKQPEAEEILRQNLTKLPIALHTLVQSSSPARDIAFSADGRLVAAAMGNGQLFIWEAETGEERATLKHSDDSSITSAFSNDSFSALAFSPDSALIAAGGLQSAFVWDVATKEQLFELPLEYLLLDIAFSPDGSNLLATASWAGKIRLWDSTTGEELHVFETGDRVARLAFSADGRFLLTGGAVGHMWDVNSYEEIATLPHDGYLLSVAFAPDGALVATASTDHTAAIWDATTSEKLHTFQHQGRVEDIVFSPDGEWVAMASEDHRIRLWHIPTQQETQMRHDDAVTRLAFSPNSRWLASVSDDQTARLWEVATGSEIGIMALEGAGSGLAFQANGRYLATTTWNGQAHLWDITPVTPDHQLIAHDTVVTTARFHPDGQSFVTISQDFKARLSPIPDENDSEPRAPLQLFSGHDTFVNDVAFNAEGTLMATASDDGSVIIWNSDTGEEMSKLIQPNASLATSVAFSPDGTYVITGNTNRKAIIWDVDSGEDIYSLEDRSLFGDGDPVTAVSYHPNGQTVAVGSGDGSVRIWNSQTGKREATLAHDGGEITAVFYAPDGFTLATASSDGTVYIWDTTNPKNPTRLHSLFHPNPVLDVAIDDQSQWIATTSNDGLVRLWDTATAQEQARIAHVSAVTSLAFSPDSTYLITTNGTTTRLWTLENLSIFNQDALSPEACRRVTRSLSKAEWTQYIAGEAGLFSSYTTFCSK